MILASEIRKRLRNGIVCPGAWLQIPSPDIAEIVTRMGYDWAVVDMEHGSFSHSQLPDMFRAIECGGAVPFARPASSSSRDIMAALDSGARGLILPMIQSRAQLDSAISAAMYPGGKEYSTGTRGVGFCRSNSYGFDFVGELDPDAGSSRDIVLVAQIEHVDAMKELDAIFSHPRLDAYMVGRYDFSASMGLTGDFSHPDFLAALETIRHKAAPYRLPAGFHVLSPNQDELVARAREGFPFLAYGVDALFLMSAARLPELPGRVHPQVREDARLRLAKGKGEE